MHMRPRIRQARKGLPRLAGWSGHGAHSGGDTPCGCGYKQDFVSNKTRETGISLIELIMFIIIVSVGIVGILPIFSVATSHSVDPLLNKQATAIAESLLTEIEQMPFSWCDPQDASATTATIGTGCTDDQNKGGAAFPLPPTPAPTPGTETRGAIDAYDNVADYAGYHQVQAGFDGRTYTSDVTITRAGGAAPFATLPLDAVLRISVTVTGPSGTSITVVGYRVRFAPNAVG